MQQNNRVSYIKSIEYYLPSNVLTNEQLAIEFPDWSVDKIFKKTGIRERRIADEGQTALDLAVCAGRKLLDKTDGREHIDYVIFCTQSPDYYLPTSACIIQNQLGLKKNVGCIDVNQGCSGYVYGLGLAKGLIETGQANNVLLLTAETYSKYINHKDKSVRTIFGDGASATFVSNKNADNYSLYSFVYGSDGAGAENLIVPSGGARNPIDNNSCTESIDSSNNIRSPKNLYMNGSEIFTFTLSSVKSLVDHVLEKSNLTYDDIDHFMFHQPNKFMLDQLKFVCKIPAEKFRLNYEIIGNTVSSSIPILIKDTLSTGLVKPNDVMLLIGFGVGYSWAGAVVEWMGDDC